MTDNFRQQQRDTLLIRGLLLGTTLLFSAMLYVLHAAHTSTVDQEAFIASIKDISIREHERAGIPASITAAQAILESNWGRAPIAVAGNNYFGIKCKSYWIGPVVMHEDDDYDDAGTLMKSCFRAYDNIEASFLDHSDFLKIGERYASLFALDPTDYKAWAHGLKACGYATDPQYAEKLIGIIERLELQTFDAAPQARLYHPLVQTDLKVIPTRREPRATLIPATYVPTGRGRAIAIRTKDND